MQRPGRKLFSLFLFRQDHEMEAALANEPQENSRKDQYHNAVNSLVQSHAEDQEVSYLLVSLLYKNIAKSSGFNH